MKPFVIFSGLPLAGKTTIAKEMVQRYGGITFDCDIYRHAIVGHDNSLSEQDEITVMVESYRRMHVDALYWATKDIPIYISATYWRPQYKPLLRELSQKKEVTIFQLTYDLQQVEERLIKRRGEQSPSDIVHRDQILEYQRRFDPIIDFPVISLDTTYGIENTVRRIKERL